MLAVKLGQVTVTLRLTSTVMRVAVKAPPGVVPLAITVPHPGPGPPSLWAGARSAVASPGGPFGLVDLHPRPGAAQVATAAPARNRPVILAAATAAGGRFTSS